MDVTIEMWSNGPHHYAECTCGFFITSEDITALETYVKEHKAKHTNNGDAVEVI